MRIRPIRSFVWYSRTTRQRNGTLHARYSGTRNDVDTTAVFTAVFEGFMTLRANNFSSGGTLVMFLVFI